jgi:phosphoribosyl 1,2-cyclic phosphodiesterase
MSDSLVANHPFGLAVEIWGARGSMPAPGASTLRYGGNTPCISVRSTAGDRVIVDAGTGIRKLGRSLLTESPRAAEINLFFTHFHWDHIQGIPFFSPLIQGGARVRFHAGVSPAETRARLERQMSDPFFTLDFNAAKAECEFLQMGCGAIRCGALVVEAFPLNHPQGAWGYRIEAGGASVVVATDVEHGHPSLDKVLRERAAKADLLIYDAQYTEVEYATRVGWGHSTAGAAAAVAADAGVKELMLFHHDPEHDDDKIDQIVAETRSWFPCTTAAREGATIFLG